MYILGRLLHQHLHFNDIWPNAIGNILNPFTGKYTETPERSAKAQKRGRNFHIDQREWLNGSQAISCSVAFE